MRKFLLVLVLLLVLLVAGGAVFLATWEPPAPLATVEIPIPNDRLLK